MSIWLRSAFIALVVCNLIAAIPAQAKDYDLVILNGRVMDPVNLFGERDARVLVGYRALYQDYEKGSGASKFEWDVTVHGPVMALNIEF